jgi:Type III restriction enzyme, res subunit
MTITEQAVRVPIVKAARIATGVGKTMMMIELLAEHIHAGKIGPVVYAVPRHKLGANIRQQFLDYGIDARIFRGRNADDPDAEPHKMCRNLAAVEVALRCHADVSKTCCSKNRKTRCEFFNKCGYQRQMPAKGDQPQVWIIASDMLFHEQAVLGKPHILVVDEGFWSRGIRGIEQEEGQKRQQGWTVALDSMRNTPEHPDDKPSLRWRNDDRGALCKALASQPHDGPVELKYLPLLSEADFGTCISREWNNMPKLKLLPGMSNAEIAKLIEEEGGIFEQSHHTRSIIRIWDEVRNMFAKNIAMSGRLTLKREGGLRVIEWRGVEPIKDQFLVKTMLMDATLPPLPILQIFHPQIKIVGDMSVEMPPSVHIKQILSTPTTSNKLEKERHRQAMRRYILKRSIELAGAPGLVICQDKLEQYLKQAKLPDNITVDHYNNISGLDDFKDVRLMILIGRTAPGPRAMERMAAALSGVQPSVLAKTRNGFTWYDEVVHGIGIRGQAEIGVGTKGDQHPDPFVEAVRWQIHEGELMQAIGRARGINRTDETPLDIDLLFDSCIPVDVDEVLAWEPPSLLIETAAEGVMLTSPTDMVKLWPELWSHRKAAQRTLGENINLPLLPGFTPVSYHLAAGNMKPRIAHFNLALIADPMAWLQERLGKVTVATL